MIERKITKEDLPEKVFEEARLDSDKRARDQRDYEMMLMDYIRKEFEGI